MELAPLGVDVVLVHLVGQDEEFVIVGKLENSSNIFWNMLLYERKGENSPLDRTCPVGLPGLMIQIAAGLASAEAYARSSSSIPILQFCSNFSIKAKFQKRKITFVQIVWYNSGAHFSKASRVKRILRNGDHDSGFWPADQHF